MSGMLSTSDNAAAFFPMGRSGRPAFLATCCDASAFVAGLSFPDFTFESVRGTAYAGITATYEGRVAACSCSVFWNLLQNRENVVFKLLCLFSLSYRCWYISCVLFLRIDCL